MFLKNGRSYSRGALSLAALTAVGVLLWQEPGPAAAEGSVTIPAASTTIENPGNGPATAVLAGGCFWGMEMVFEHVGGVTDVVSGYAGGDASTANYRASSTGRTDHAEAVRITYDPEKIGYTDLLRIYFSVAHDPTQVNRQGPDTGREYRSEVFALDSNQASAARAYIGQLGNAGVFGAPIATKVSRLEPDSFYPAESYHQNYGARHPDSLYIQINDAPKIKALQQQFAQRYRATRAEQLATVE